MMVYVYVCVLGGGTHAPKAISSRALSLDSSGNNTPESFQFGC